jgi:hypothetical protein
MGGGAVGFTVTNGTGGFGGIGMEGCGGDMGIGADVDMGAPPDGITTGFTGASGEGDLYSV